MARGVWGVDIRSLDTGEHLFDLNAGRLMMPASNMKIVTLAVAADVLGWDHRFTTTLETSAADRRRGVLKGDLFVRGGGDPTINARDGAGAQRVLDEWAAALSAAGIQQIDGRIIGDDQRFDDEGIGPGWAWDYLQFGYAAPVGALQFNENLATLTVRPAAQAGDPAEVTLTPGAGLTLVSSRRHGRCRFGRRHSTIAAGSIRPVLEVSGTHCRRRPRRSNAAVAVVNPTIFFAQSLKDGLIARGIAVSGAAVDLDDVAAELAGSASRTPHDRGDEVAAVARDRNRADESQPEPVRRDARSRRSARRAAGSGRSKAA